MRPGHRFHWLAAVTFVAAVGVPGCGGGGSTDTIRYSSDLPPSLITDLQRHASDDDCGISHDVISGGSVWKAYGLGGQVNYVCTGTSPYRPHLGMIWVFRLAGPDDDGKKLFLAQSGPVTLTKTPPPGPVEDIRRAGLRFRTADGRTGSIRMPLQPRLATFELDP